MIRLSVEEKYPPLSIEASERGFPVTKKTTVKKVA